jgi:LysR family transcriptional regulator for metE and metH
MDVETRYLRLVSELQATGSATSAGLRLGVTQSAISHQLRELEARLKTPVCFRVGKRLILTPAGNRLLRAAQAVLPELDRALQDVARLRDGHTGMLRVCAQCHTGYHWLPPVLQKFQARHPEVEVEIAVQHTNRPVDALLEGTLDLALVTDTIDDKRLRVQALLTDEHAAIVWPDHPWTAQRFVTPEQLGSEVLLLYSTSPMDSFTVRRILHPAGVRPARVQFVQLTEAILEMVKARLGVSVMPMWAVAPGLARGDIRAVRISPSGVHRQWSAVTLKDVNEPAYLKDFVTLTRKAIDLHGAGRRAAAKRSV